MTLGRLVLVAGVLLAGVADPAQAQLADLEPLLRDLQIDPGTVGIRDQDLGFMLGDRRQASQFVTLLMTEPLRADGFAGALAANLLQSAAADPAQTLLCVSYFNSRKLSRGLLGDPSAAAQAASTQPDALMDVLGRIGLEAEPAQNALDGLPTSVKQAAALLLNAELSARDWVRRGQATVPEASWQRLDARLREPLKTGAEEDAEPTDPDLHLLYRDALESFAPNLLMAGAQDLLYALRSARATLKADAALASATFQFRVPTKLGWVILADGRDDTHAAQGAVLLLLDIGGNDTHADAGANFSRSECVSVALDLGGDDHYEVPAGALGSFGAGTMGIGLLWDDEGDDVYVADRRSQGAGVFGVGVLVDAAGADQYRAIDDSQGSATAGYGLLIDLAGDDRYECYRFSQGASGPNAGAALVDAAGNDTYTANDADLRYPSAQTPQHNTSMSQGASQGWREDFSDGRSVAGGVAVLCDGGGDDQYSCGLFGQGVGYWYAVGMLLDQAGHDRYSGVWYVQGASAHFAGGMLFDRAGNDEYRALINMSQGAGHDLSVGVLIDDAGDDLYEATNLGLGASNAAGIGLCFDRSGNDRYHAPAGGCLGFVSENDGYRALMRAYGLFVDASGDDEYTGRDGQGATRPEAGNGKSWRMPADAPAGAFRRGAGWDR